jgi:hypothetical protein
MPSTMAQSIIGRLKGILSDCKNMLLGPQQQDAGYEIQDLAFGVQREVNEAFRRGRRGQ